MSEVPALSVAVVVATALTVLIVGVAKRLDAVDCEVVGAAEVVSFVTTVTVAVVVILVMAVLAAGADVTLLVAVFTRVQGLLAELSVAVVLAMTHTNIPTSKRYTSKTAKIRRLVRFVI